MVHFQFPSPTTCRCCHPHWFYHHESNDMCCTGGQVSLPQINSPQELFEIVLDSMSKGRNFRHHIRSYNHLLSFRILLPYIRSFTIFVPIAPQVAGIIVGEDAESMARGWNINVVKHNRNLIRIQETVGYYDPLQYH